MADLWLNGRLVSESEACVSPFDRGLQHAVGLFETMRGGLSASEAWVFGLDAHLARIKASALELGLVDELHTHPLADAIRAATRHAGHANARIRLTVTGGVLRCALAADSAGKCPTVLVDVRPATVYPDAMFERGIAAAIADARANPFNPLEGHKTLNYWWRLRELQAASAKGAGEAIVLSVSNHLVGGCVSNALLVKDGTLLTPIARGEEAQVGGAGALPSPVLPGTTRTWALEHARALSLDVARRVIAIDDILDADELMLTNSSWGVLPVIAVERKAIGPGTVGEVARALRTGWLAALDEAATKVSESPA